MVSLQILFEQLCDVGESSDRVPSDDLILVETVSGEHIQKIVKQIRLSRQTLQIQLLAAMA